ncbi:DUF418 domain-containing protein [Maribacter sp. 2-571]|uniref:DUF418 domain-containing protein n=1 Tax=Maribacter sp. 2-571 TaxID=3417569 RepID=UPI003D34D27E
MATKNERIEIIDALRGFALAGIAICHIVEQYIGAQAPSAFYESVNPSITDQIINALIGIFLRGKFIALFSFLFGLSFFIQMDNARNKEVPFAGRFLWRLLLLLGIGYVHSFFYRGDILTVYAFLGIFLIPFYRLGSKWILGIAFILFLGLGRFVIFKYFGGEHLFLEQTDTTGTDAPRVVGYYNTLKEGGLLEVFKTNAVEGHLDKLNFQYGLFGRGYFTFAFFLIGLYAGRIGFFKRFRTDKNMTKQVLIWSGVGLVVAMGVTAAAFSSIGPDVQMNNWTAMVGLTGMDLANMTMTFLYIALFVVLYRKRKMERLLGKFAPFGRMALTNYVLQSLIGTFLFFGWGLGYLGVLQNTYTFFIALALITIQIVYSKKWLQHFYYGPFEWLWRSLTFFKKYPLRRKPLKE